MTAMSGNNVEIGRRTFLYLSGVLGSAAGVAGRFGGAKVLLKAPVKEQMPRHTENLFRTNGKSLVSVAQGKDVKTMVRGAVAAVGGFGRMGIKGKTVLVKPNILSARKSPTTTNPGVVRETVKLLYEHGASRVLVGDMSALWKLPTRQNMERTGKMKAVQDAGAEPLFFEDHDWIRVKLEKGKYIKEVDVSEWIFKADKVVNLPVIKTHHSAQYSICLKNFVGATNFRQRPYFADVRHWEEVVAEINLAYAPDLNIVDGTTIMVEGGPWEGKEEETDLVIASGDRVAADVVGIALIKSFGLWRDAPETPWQARQIKRAVELGLGAGNREGMKLVAASPESRDVADLLRKIEDLI
jgi:uncharacterized protein (DUF362 family)